MIVPYIGPHQGRLNHESDKQKAGRTPRRGSVTVLTAASVCPGIDTGPDWSQNLTLQWNYIRQGKTSALCDPLSRPAPTLAQLVRLINWG